MPISVQTQLGNNCRNLRRRGGLVVVLGNPAESGNFKAGTKLPEVVIKYREIGDIAILAVTRIRKNPAKKFMMMEFSL